MPEKLRHQQAMNQATQMGYANGLNRAAVQIVLL